MIHSQDPRKCDREATFDINHEIWVRQRSEQREQKLPKNESEKKLKAPKGLEKNRNLVDG
jgi:hypothetical protein